MPPETLLSELRNVNPPVISTRVSTKYMPQHGLRAPACMGLMLTRECQYQALGARLAEDSHGHAPDGRRDCEPHHAVYVQILRTMDM